MNTNLGLIGKKLGLTQIFAEDGTVTSVTVVQAGPCRVVGKRTEAANGYSALQLAFGEKKAKHVNKPEAGFYKKIEQTPAERLQEFRLPAAKLADYEIGQTLSAGDLFEEGQRIDVTGTSKGAGFAGVMKRHNFHGAGTVGHGTHEAKRHGGSIGMNMTPGRTLPTQKMPGQHGNRTHTILGTKVARVMAEENLVLVKGGIPGPKNGFVTIKGAVKRKGKGPIAE